MREQAQAGRHDLRWRPLLQGQLLRRLLGRTELPRRRGPDRLRGQGHACVDCGVCTSFAASCGGGGTKHCLGIPKSDGSTCSGGLCHDGGCCKGCFDGQYCQAGSTDARCGSGGVTCVDCTQTECRTAASSCSQGACGAQAKPDGSTCTGGTCYGGLCCKGCWDGTKKKCLTGTTASACGVGGGACKSCPSAPTCKQYSCQNGGCSLGNAADGAGCSGGTCYSGTCCGGCWTGTMCAGGGTDDQCGSGGGACTSCTAAGLVCSGGACVSSGG